jgi:hypothetical protein
MEKGQRLQVAARLAGVSVSTAEEWRRRGEDRDSIRPNGKVYRQFANDVALAEAKFEQTQIDALVAQAPRDPSAAKQMLAWRFPHLYGDQVGRQALTPTAPAMPQINGSNVLIVSPADLERIGLDYLHQRRLGDGGSDTDLDGLWVGPDSDQ